jgi:hypothetical protein
MGGSRSRASSKGSACIGSGLEEVDRSGWSGAKWSESEANGSDRSGRNEVDWKGVRRTGPEGAGEAGSARAEAERNGA